MILFLNLIYFHSFLNHSLIISMYILTYFSSCFPRKIVLSSLHIKFHVLFLSQKNNKGAVSTLGSTESLTLLKKVQVSWPENMGTGDMVPKLMYHMAA